MKAILNNEQVEISDAQIERYAMVRKAMADFQARNPEYEPTQANADKLIDLLEARGQEITIENLQSAFYALRSELQLRKLALREADFKGPSVEQQRTLQSAEDARAELIESTHCAIYEDSAGREVWLPLFHLIVDGKDTGKTAVKDDVSRLTLFAQSQERIDRSSCSVLVRCLAFIGMVCWSRPEINSTIGMASCIVRVRIKPRDRNPPLTRDEVEGWSSEEMRAQIANGNEFPAQK